MAMGADFNNDGMPDVLVRQTGGDSLFCTRITSPGKII